MGLTNYPFGVSSFGIPLVGSGPILTTGNIFFVSSVSGSNGNDGLSPSRPWATVDYAIGRCTANNGDHIIVMPNHAETSTNTAGYWAFDVAGVTCIGLGVYNQRPRLLLDAGIAATITVSAADVKIKNIVVASGTADVTRAINVTGVGCVLEEIEFTDNVADENFLTCVDATGAANTADGLAVINCRWVSADALSGPFVTIANNIVNLQIDSNLIVHEGVTCPIFSQAGTTTMLRSRVTWNYLSGKGANATDLAFDNGGTGNSGVIAHNRVGHADVTSAHVLGAVAGMRFFDNLSVSTDALSGFVLPAIDVDL